MHELRLRINKCHHGLFSQAPDDEPREKGKFMITFQAQISQSLDLMLRFRHKSPEKSINIIRLIIMK